MRLGTLAFLIASLAMPADARRDVVGCGTTAETSKETIFLHRQAARARGLRALAPVSASGVRDVGNIVVIEDADGVVARQNEFSLNGKMVEFRPAAAGAVSYTFSLSDGGYDDAVASQGTPLAALDDDDTRLASLPFAFPFFGASYRQVYINSDGNLTFGAGDSASTNRSLGRMTSGPPRISPLLDDLNPAQTAGGVRVFADASRVVVSWVKVPEWVSIGFGATQTFQVSLYPDGRIDFAYSDVHPGNGVVGIAPGNLAGSTTLVDFRNDVSGQYNAAVAERFGSLLSVDDLVVAQKFFQAHEDAYDYLMIYNNMDIDAMDGAVAYTNAVRRIGSGYGTLPNDDGKQYGSASRLKAVINMGQLQQYPVDPNGVVPRRKPSGDTPLTVLAHETGHLFLAFASVADPDDPTLKPMLGYQNAHWSFTFNSEASLLQGERIADQGTNVSPRFLTTDTVQGYSPLDQYLMGFRAPKEVPDTFVVTNVPASLMNLYPITGVTFDGTRRNVSVNDVIQAVGRRTPDDTVAQRRFRFAIVVVTASGKDPSADDLARLEAYRQQFEAFFAQATSSNAVAETALKRSMKLSLSPASGVLAAGTAMATLTVATAPSVDLTVQFATPNGKAKFPASATIPAKVTTASFAFSGVSAGVEEVSAIPGDPTYETAVARVQVGDAALLKIAAVSGDRQVSTSGAPLPDPVVVRLTDANDLPYPNARIVAAASVGGSVSPASAVTDAQGNAQFTWTPGSADSNQLMLSLEGTPAVSLAVKAGRAVPVIQSAANAASFAAGIGIGALATVSGAALAGGQTASAGYPWPDRLAGVQVLVNGKAAPVFYVSDAQINFYVPADTQPGAATVTVVTPSGARAVSTTAASAIQPGIFAGAVLHAGTSVSAVTTPVRAGEYIEVYCTGLGPTGTVAGLRQTVVLPTVFVGAVPVQPSYSGPTQGIDGLYQVNVQVPQGVASGMQSILISSNLAHSNQIQIAVQ